MFDPYFDQEAPEIPITGLIADEDRSSSYELDAAAVFKCRRGYLIVWVSGCSCWPDRGGTTQQYCHNKTEVDRHLTDSGWGSLRHSCQSVSWKITQKAPDEQHYSR